MHGCAMPRAWVQTTVSILARSPQRQGWLPARRAVSPDKSGNYLAAKQRLDLLGDRVRPELARFVGIAADQHARLPALDRDLLAALQAIGDLEARAAELDDLGLDDDGFAVSGWHLEPRVGLDERPAGEAVAAEQLLFRQARL